MPRGVKKTEEVTTDPKAALGFDDVVPKDGGPSAPSPGGDEEQETEEHKNAAETPDPRIAELEAKIAKFEALLATQSEPKQSARPVPESELSPEQRRIRDLEDQLARREGKNDSMEERFEDAEGGIVIHFIADGFTSNYRNFYKGQEVTFGPEAYEETVDRLGRSWLDLSEEEQWDRFGEVKFRKGPWPGRRQYAEESLKNVSIEEQAPVINI